MTELKVYKLHFTSPLHIANTRSDYSISNQTIASDTMYAAITSCLAKLGKEIPNNGDLGFTISSLFPYYQEKKEEKPLYFFPKPMQSKLPVLDIENNKKIKKIRWVDTEYFSQMLFGKDIEKENPNFIENIQGDYLCKTKFNNKFISSKVSQRIRLKDRYMESEAEPYWVDRVFFKDYSGLFFIVEGNTSLLDKALPLLAIEGIGSDRNIGNGFFKIEKDTIYLDIPQKADYCVTLSVFFPENKDSLSLMINDENAAYEIQRRGGWITTAPYQNLRKNFIYAFKEGAVLRNETSSMKTIGRIVDLQPKWNDKLHNIWRCGYSLVLPIKL